MGCPGSVPDLTGPDGRQARFARDCLQELATLAGQVTVDELLREALARTGFLATLSGLYDGERRRGNVENFWSRPGKADALHGI